MTIAFLICSPPKCSRGLVHSHLGGGAIGRARDPGFISRLNASSTRCPDRPCTCSGHAILERLQPNRGRRRIYGAIQHVGPVGIGAQTTRIERYGLREANGKSYLALYASYTQR